MSAPQHKVLSAMVYPPGESPIIYIPGQGGVKSVAPFMDQLGKLSHVVVSFETGRFLGHYGIPASIETEIPSVVVAIGVKLT